MLRRHYWVLIALLLPLMVVFGGRGGASAFAAETQVSSLIFVFEGQPLDRRQAIAACASEAADEEEPPKKACRTTTPVAWPCDHLASARHESAPSHIGGPPVTWAARPRAPPALS